MRGIITAIRLDKGFGFLRGVDDGQDRFFNRSNVESFGSLEEGAEVDFEPYSLPPPASDQPRDPSKQHNNLRARKIRVRS